MKPLRKELALLRLGSYLNLIQNCIERAWQEYSSYPVEHRLKHTSRSRASLMHDHIVFAARLAFDGITDINMVEINKLFIVTFGADIALRFKKLDDNLRSSGIETQQSLDFSRQFDLPGIASVTHLEAGYRLNRLGTALAGVYICCPNGISILWHHEIKSGAADNNVIQLPRATGPRGGAQIESIEDDKEGSEDDGNS